MLDKYASKVVMVCENILGGITLDKYASKVVMVCKIY